VSQWYGTSHGSDVSIPFFTSSLGYAFVFNLPSFGTVSLTAQSQSWFSNATHNMDFWISATAAADVAAPWASLLNAYSAVVGYPAALPYFATGFIQCKVRQAIFRYRSFIQSHTLISGSVPKPNSVA
jgi:alpha-D-xyloside xylohydrolase